jgi:hypothetical protein
MKKLKYSKDYFEKFLKYDETSKSCLVWLHNQISAGSKGNCGYVVSVDKVCYSVHRIIYCLFFNTTDEDMVIDHLDGNFFNNKIENLRLVTIRENNFNRKAQSNSNSGISGVRYDDSDNRCIAAWVDKEGKERRKSFAYKKFGSRRDAFIAAKNFRQEMICVLKEQGLCYTDRHGI